MNPDQEAAALLRNLPSWVSVGLGLLSFFFVITNNYTNQATRIAVASIGLVACLCQALATVVFHWDFFRKTRQLHRLVLTVALVNVAPSLIWFLAFFTSSEFRVSQNKV